MSNSEVIYKSVTITPEYAQRLLDSMPDYQRRPSKLAVTGYACDMLDGNWNPNTGEPIKINRQRQMVDGQHRCLAVIESGVPIKATLAIGVDDEAYKVIDSGRKRSIADALGISHGKDVGAVSKAIVMLTGFYPLSRILSNGGGAADWMRTPVTRPMITRTATALSSEIEEIVALSILLKNSIRKNIFASSITCLAAYAYEKLGSLNELSEFCEDMSRPAEERSPICSMAREALIRAMGTQNHSKQVMAFSILKLAFDRWIEGTVPKYIAWQTVANNLAKIPVRRDWGL